MNLFEYLYNILLILYPQVRFEIIYNSHIEIPA